MSVGRGDGGDVALHGYLVNTYCGSEISAEGSYPGACARREESGSFIVEHIAVGDGGKQSGANHLELIGTKGHRRERRLNGGIGGGEGLDAGIGEVHETG